MLRKSPPESGGILFYGSSTMANWRANDMCYKHMKGLPLTNIDSDELWAVARSRQSAPYV